MTPKVSRSSLVMKVDMPGATAPLGFFDPLGFTKGANVATLSKYREAEIKHGRVAMLAVFGILTAEKFHPLYDGKLSGNPLDAWNNVPQLAKLQIFLFCGFLEFVFNQVKKNENYKVPIHVITPTQRSLTNPIIVLLTQTIIQSRTRTYYCSTTHPAYY